MSSIRKQVEKITKKRIAENSLVSLHEFREIKNSDQRKVILAVDDEEVMRNALKRVLDTHGYTAVLAEDGISLAKILETTHLDLILLDVNLPWVNGFELCQMIKSHSVLKTTPIILISGKAAIDDVHKGISLGADDFVSKPFDVDHLLKVIEKNLKKAG